MEDKITYADAMEELESIVNDIENSSIPVDDLLYKVKRASELIGICKEKLFHTSSEVNKIIESLKDDAVKP